MKEMTLNINVHTVGQFARYIVVGVLNTLVTLAVIYLCKSVFEINLWVSNALGYVAGVINSFVWNKKWVFKSTSRRYKEEALRFLAGFALCYGIQLLATWILDSSMKGVEIAIPHITVVSGYGIATLAGMVIYTIANFIFNRVVTFKQN